MVGQFAPLVQFGSQGHDCWYSKRATQDLKRQFQWEKLCKEGTRVYTYIRRNVMRGEINSLRHGPHLRSVSPGGRSSFSSFSAAIPLGSLVMFLALDLQCLV